MTRDAKHATPEGREHIRVLSGGGRTVGWHEIDHHDHRFPSSGSGLLWYIRSSNGITLLNQHGKGWADLEGFPHFLTPNSRGNLYAYNLDYPPCPYRSDGKWLGDWFIKPSKMNNLAFFDPNENGFLQTVHSCTEDTGWRFDTSASVGGSFGMGGGGVGAQTLKLVFMRKEPNDARRWELMLVAGAAGVMTPGASVSGSTYDTRSEGVSAVRRGPFGNKPFPAADLGGIVTFFDVGGGVSVGLRGGGMGKGASTTTFVFLSGASYSGGMPSLAGVKAVLQVWGLSNAGSKQGKLLDKGAQAMLWAGWGYISQRP
jgi:hypothetical protein